MSWVHYFKETVTGPARFSYLFMIGLVVLVAAAHLGPMFIAVLFSYLVVNLLHFFKKRTKWIAVGLFVVLFAGVSYVLGHFTRQTVRALPDIAEKAVPSVIEYAKKHGVDTGFTDFDSLKEAVIESARGQARYIGSFAKFARGATTELVSLLIGIVIALALFIYPGFDLPGVRPRSESNLYALCCEELAQRFKRFYQSFATVLGAQIIISGINTVLTAIFVFAVQLPYALVVVGVTFLCGLVPVVGNLISNTIIVGVGFTVSPRMAVAALVFLVVIHKLEYFLNSKIIGHRIRNPVWLTLVALIIGERLMGIPGVVLAPVLLHYIKVEASALEVTPKPAPEPEGFAT